MTPADLSAWQARLDLSQVEAARLLGHPPATYRNWIHGRREIPGSIPLLCGYLERDPALSRPGHVATS